jgi:hypothetical protein
MRGQLLRGVPISGQQRLNWPQQSVNSPLNSRRQPSTVDTNEICARRREAFAFFACCSANSQRRRPRVSSTSTTAVATRATPRNARPAGPTEPLAASPSSSPVYTSTLKRGTNISEARA